MDRNKKGLMQIDPMTGMPVAQPGSTPMFPVSQGANAGSTAKFNPMINQYASADPLANAAYASQPMPGLAQHKRIMTMEKEAPKPTMSMKKVIQNLPPEQGVKTEVIEPTMRMGKVIKSLEPVQDTLTYKQMATGRRIEKFLSDPEMLKAVKIGKQVGNALPQDKPIPKGSGLEDLVESGPKGKAAVEKMGYNPNALARMRGNGMYKKNCGYKK